MNVYQDFKSLSCILFGCLEINVIYKASKYAILQGKVLEINRKSSKTRDSGKTIQELSNTAVTDINCFCIEFNASVAKNTAIFVAFCTTKSVKSI